MDLQLPRASSSCSMAPMQALCYSAGAIDAMSDGSLLSIESHRSVPAPFLTKTYQLVDDPTTDHIVSWGEDESTFVVWRPPEFARDLLPNYFKHNNFSSFVRQLNTYGFRKIVPDRWEFANEFFRKGEKHLLCEIHRRKTAQNRCSPTNSSDELILQPQTAMQPWSPLPATTMGASCSSALAAMAAAQHHASSMHQAAMAAHGGRTQVLNVGVQCGALSLSDENERLRRDNTLLLSELARMKKLYHDVLLYLQQQNIQLQPSPCVAGAQNHGLQLISELSSQSSSFNHMPSSQKSLIYHSSPSMSAMQSNVESPTSRLTACAGDHAKPFVSTTVTPSAPIPAMGLVGSAPTGRHDTVLLQNGGCVISGNLRNFRSPTITTSSVVPAQSILSKSTSSDKEIEFRTKANADECRKSPPKLFGVPLHSSKKRPLPDLECDEPRFSDNVVLSKSSLTTSSPLLKSAKSHSELALELKPPSIGSTNSMHALWLKFKAPRDEQVYN